MLVLEEALRLASLGFQILALHAPTPTGCSCGRQDCPAVGKHPILHRWQESSNEDNLGLLREEPRANLGLITGYRSGVYVLDVDPKNGGFESLKALEAKIGKLPATVTARTGSGGQHLIFAYPKDGQVKNSAGKLGKGLDVRGDNGQIVVAPSRHVSGGAYACSPRLGELPLADGGPLLALVKRAAKVTPSLAQTPGINVETDAFRAKLRRIRNEETRELVRRVLDGEVLAGPSEETASVTDGFGRNSVLYRTLSTVIFAAPEASDAQLIELFATSVDRMVAAGSEQVSREIFVDMIPRTRVDWVEKKAVEKAQDLAWLRSLMPGSVPKAALIRDPSAPPDKEDQGSVMAESPAGEAPPDAKLYFPLTDTGNCERFVVDHGEDLRYCHAQKAWFLWDNTRWLKDDNDTAFLCTKITVRKISLQASEIEDDKQRKALSAWAKQSESISARKAILEGAKGEQTIAIKASAFNADPWALNCLNGILNLKTGDLEPHRRSAYCSNLAPVEYDPHATCPRWHAFLAEVQPDVEKRAYLQRLFGYALTGVVREHVVAINYGEGGNGKTVSNEVRQRIMGDYARQVPTELLVEKRGGEGGYYERSTLWGCRFASASETDENRALNVALVKQITGGDMISARFMRENYFNFMPTHKLELLTNHKPQIREMKEAIWRRIHLISWDVIIPASRANLALASELFEAEAEGIFAWMVEGCRLWQLLGLSPPASVTSATRAYRDEEDVVGEFLTDCTEIYADGLVPVVELRRVYEAWCQGVGHAPLSARVFNARLDAKGFKHRSPKDASRRTVKSWAGLRISSASSEGAQTLSEKLQQQKQSTQKN